MTLRLFRFLAALVLLLAAVTARADVKLPFILSDNMVLQGSRAVLWGAAAPNETVVVKIGSKKGKATADAQGRWTVVLQRLKSGGPYEMTITGRNAITIHNVAVGEAWLCAGASNMAFPLNGAAGADKEIAAAAYPMIRVFSVDKSVAPSPAADCAGRWVACDPRTANAFPAVGYYFGRDLHKKLKVPIGLIDSSVSATPAAAWIPQSALDAKPELKALEDQWKTDTESYPEAKKAYGELYATWKVENARAKAANQPLPAPPRIPKAPDDPSAPCGVYNAMIAPLIPFSIKGAIWYQGESNTGDPGLYRTLFPALITSWRKAWGEGDFPFLFVQLAGFLPRSAEPSDSLWAELRESQAAALKLPATGMAVAIDIGDEHSLLPKNKEEVGRRLALAAQEIAYGLADTGQEPLFAAMKIAGGKARITFTHTGGGLAVKGDEPLKGFAIAGADKRFFPAEARLEKNRVFVSSDKVPKPVAVRYAWADTPDGNLSNKEGLPAAPFRTDTWNETAPASGPDSSAPLNAVPASTAGQ